MERLHQENRYEAERDRVLDAQREFGEAIMRKLQPGLSRVLREMFIDAATELTFRFAATE